MAYLDGELAPEEKRELELHVVDCGDCKKHLEAERADQAMLRAALAPPPAPDMVKARIARALDQEDARIAGANKQAARTRLGKWLLPGTALAAAAAALALFIGAGVTDKAKNNESTTVAKEVVRQQIRSLPLEVQGASTGRWLRQNFAAVEPPQFTDPGIELIGARATAVAGHDAALLRYLVNVGVNRVSLTAVLIADMRGDELSNGQPVKIGNLTFRIHDADGQPAISFIDQNHVGYVFTSERMSMQELIELVTTSDLIARSQQQIR
ncbi:MAG: zf-HC2 domain-containing protein [Deltaproteobacteria bacterium]|nr:zf-HC2 domain-containing protein [Deltaproteobacteria bacterium]